MATAKKYNEGGIEYERKDDGTLYKNGVIVPESNYKYIPSAIGGTRGTTVLPDSTVTDTTSTDKGLTAGYSPETLDFLEKYKTGLNTPYDPSNVYNSDLYKSQKESYTNMGQNAFQDTIGRLASYTGGRPSTAAVGTAANANNQYQQQFASTVLPSLIEQDYGMYRDQKTDDYNFLQTLMTKDLNEFDMSLALEEYEWSKNENNPTVKAQILANKLAEIDLQYYDEEKQAELEQIRLDIEKAKILLPYAGREAEAQLDILYAQLDGIIIDNENAKKESTASEGMTAGQMGHYNTILTNLKSLFADDPNAALAYAETNKDAYISSIGEAGYQQLIGELDDFARAEPQTEEPVYDFKSIDSDVGDMFAAWTGGQDQATDTQAINSAVTYIIDMMEAGNLTTAQVDSMLRKFAAKYPGMPADRMALETYYYKMS
jgi:hypothetical protein